MYRTSKEAFRDLNWLNDRGVTSLFNVVTTKNTFEWEPNVDLVEFDDRYELDMELAGVDPKAIDVNAREDILTIAGEKTSSKKVENKEAVYVSETRNGQFKRSFRLKSIDNTAILAESKHGVLQVVIPKRADSASQSIEIKVS